jgi:hypothetical protein
MKMSSILSRFKKNTCSQCTQQVLISLIDCVASSPLGSLFHQLAVPFLSTVAALFYLDLPALLDYLIVD